MTPLDDTHATYIFTSLHTSPTYTIHHPINSLYSFPSSFLLYSKTSPSKHNYLNFVFIPKRMEEEFQESDVVFSDYYKPHSHYHIQLGKRNKKKKQRPNRSDKSPPLDIPNSVNGIRFVDAIIEYDDDLECDNEDSEGNMLPPHLIIAQRINSYSYYNVRRKMACSLHIEDEKGRILKGRNLFEVRNSILRLTGFIET